MDPVSAAGLGLGITPLAFQLLGGCIKAYEMFLDMAEMPANFEHLRLRMRLEQSRLLNWGEKVGILEGTPQQPSPTLQLHRDIIIDILLETQRLFKDCLKIEAQFDRVGHFSVDERPVRAQPAMLQSPDNRNPLLAGVLRAWGKTAQVPARLQWALVKHDRFEQLVEKLISYNNAMVSLLDRTTIQQLYEMQVQSHLALLQLSSQVDDLKRLAQAIQIQTQDRTPMFSTINFNDLPGMSKDQSAEEVRFARLANFKADQVTLELDSTPVSIGVIDRKLITLTNTVDARSMAVYKEETVWVEWKACDPEHQVSSWSQLVEDRVSKLAVLLGMRDTPAEFRAPRCLGYFRDDDDDEARFGLVYRKPAGPSYSKPVPLLDMFRQAQKPSLTQRVKPAHNLSESLMYLHSVNWLHKGIRSENIIFFPPSEHTADYGTPTISGFDYARPDLPEEITERPAEIFEHDMYRHPDALGRSGTRSKKSWDIYSLGVVLVEIAFWRSIEDVLDIHANQKNAWSKLRKIRNVLLEDHFLDSVGAQTGERYKDCVRRCIRGGADLAIPASADEADSEIGVRMPQTFSQDVVKRLKGREV